MDPLKHSLHWGWLSSGITCMAMFAAFPSTIMEAAGAFGARPTVVESIMVDGKAANIAIQVIPDESHPQ